MQSQSILKITRPKLVWVIGIYYLISYLVSLVFYIEFLGGIALPIEIQDVFDRMTIWGVFLSIAVGTSYMIGAILLIFLRRKSFYFFLFSLLMNIFMMCWYIFTKGLAVFLSQESLWGVCLGWGIVILILWYIKKLDKNGILVS